MIHTPPVTHPHNSSDLTYRLITRTLTFRGSKHSACHPALTMQRWNKGGSAAHRVTGLISVTAQHTDTVVTLFDWQVIHDNCSAAAKTWYSERDGEGEKRTNIFGFSHSNPWNYWMEHICVIHSYIFLDGFADVEVVKLREMSSQIKIMTS